MSRRLLVALAAAMLLVCALALHTQAQEEARQDLSFVEVGAANTINAAAAAPMQEIAALLVEANRNIHRLQQSRLPYKVEQNHIRVRRHTEIQLGNPSKLPVRKLKGKINAQLVAPLSQPTIHDPQRFGTKYPITPGRDYVTADIVGEDGKPYVPRKQWDKIKEDKKVWRSPFAKYIHPPAVGSAADVVNADANINLTPVERKTVANLQFRLKSLLDQLGANVVWDHTKVANRRVVAEFDAIKVETRALLEEYELRTGVKTIAWQLQDPDPEGLYVPNGAVTDIHFGNNPELASRPLQRKGDKRPPPPPTEEQLREFTAVHQEDKLKPQEQRVAVQLDKQTDGTVKATVDLTVVDSKQKAPGAPPATFARPPVAGKVYPSGKVGAPSLPVQIDVVAPENEVLNRNGHVAQQLQQEQPKINL